MSCVVVFRQPDRIILASDSLEASIDEQYDVIERRTNCYGKVRQYGPWALTVVGMSSYDRVDVRDVIGNEVCETRTITDAIAAVQRVFVKQLFPVLQEKSTYTAFSDLFAAVGGALISVIVAGKDRDGVLAVGGFGASIVKLHPLECSMYAGTLPGIWGDAHTPFYLAEGQALAASLVQERPDWLVKGDADAARRVLERQIAATPNDVRPPIHVWEITHDGVRKLEEPCSAQTN